VLKRDGFICRYCGRGAPVVELRVDHVIPKSLDGPDTIDNLVAACHDCNAGKGSGELSLDGRYSK
jgi:5-methylcytosine-specific restriction endonuclease McrA